MSRVATSQRIVKYILLIFLCFDSVFSATTETVHTLEDDEDGDNYGEDEDILRNDFFRFTTRARYAGEDWIVPTSSYGNLDRLAANPEFLLYVVVPIVVVGFILTIAFLCLLTARDAEGCCFDSHSHSSGTRRRFTTGNRPPERRRDLTTQTHISPTGRNQHSDLRRDAIGVNITFGDSPFASFTQSRTEPRNAVAEQPPNYSIVTLNDLVNPSRPAFPVVKKDKETPPPQYGIENPLFK